MHRLPCAEFYFTPLLRNALLTETLGDKNTMRPEIGHTSWIRVFPKYYGLKNSHPVLCIEHLCELRSLILLNTNVVKY